MITGQNHEQEVRVESAHDMGKQSSVVVTVPIEVFVGNKTRVRMTPEAALKVAHRIIDVAEDLIKQNQ